MPKLTQNEMILRHIKDYGSITSREAFVEYGIMRLASRICDLKKLGFEFDIINETALNRYGQKTHYTRYSFKE